MNLSQLETMHRKLKRDKKKKDDPAELFGMCEKEGILYCLLCNGSLSCDCY